MLSLPAPLCTPPDNPCPLTDKNHPLEDTSLLLLDEPYLNHGCPPRQPSPRNGFTSSTVTAIYPNRGPVRSLWSCQIYLTPPPGSHCNGSCQIFKTWVTPVIQLVNLNSDEAELRSYCVHPLSRCPQPSEYSQAPGPQADFLRAQNPNRSR